MVRMEEGRPATYVLSEKRSLDTMLRPKPHEAIAVSPYADKDRAVLIRVKTGTGNWGNRRTRIQQDLAEP
jgi:hypothetical protein